MKAKPVYVYEAGTCGYDIFRSLTEMGFDCAVCSPAHIPKSPAERIKTDRRDAMMLASLHRAGELTYVFVPRAEDEPMRDLSRAREDAVKAQRVARQQTGCLQPPETSTNLISLVSCSHNTGLISHLKVHYKTGQIICYKSGHIINS